MGSKSYIQDNQNVLESSEAPIMSYSKNYIQEDNKMLSRMVDDQSIFFNGIDDSRKCNIEKHNYWVEIIVSGEIEVPTIKPPIKEIDSVNVKIQIVNQRVVKTPAIIDYKTGVITPVKNLQNRITTGRKLIVEGLVCVSISYLSKNSEESLNTFNGFIPFSTSIVLSQFPMASSNLDALNMGYTIVTCVETIKVNEFTDTSVSLCVPLMLQGIPTGTDGNNSRYGLIPKAPYSYMVAEEDETQCYKNNAPLIKGICPEAKIETLLRNSNDNLWTEICIPEILTLPLYKPSVDQILSFASKVDILCLKVIKTQIVSKASYEGLVLTGRKLLVEAILRQRVTYTTSKEPSDQSIHTAHFDVPISSFIILPREVNIDNRFLVTASIEDIFISSIDKRRIFKNSTIFFKAIPFKSEGGC